MLLQYIFILIDTKKLTTMEEFECKECGKKFNSGESLNQHKIAKHEQNKKKDHQFKIEKKYLYLMVAILVVFALGFWIYHSVTSPGKYDGFAKCLTEKGFVMAGTDWCSNCQNQKGYFGKSFQYIDYKNCDVAKAWCQENGVNRYPTWILPDSIKMSGAKKLYELSRLSGCKLE
jgi:hypothetical protein